MRGRRVLMESFVSHGVRHIFGNPGTTETPLLDSLPAFPQLDYVMALHEGVAVSAASFYAQASGRATVANLHVAPGLGNGIGSLYGALKANSPLVVTAGQQDTRMRLNNPLLGHDLVAMAAPVTKWSVQIERADEIAPILRRAFKVATDAPQGPVFVSLPIDVLEQETAVDAVGAGQSVAIHATRSGWRGSAGLAAPEVEEAGHHRRRRRGAIRRRTGAGRAGGSDRRLRCGSKGCGITRPSRPAIRTTASRSPATPGRCARRSAMPISCCSSADRSSRTSGLRRAATSPTAPLSAGRSIPPNVWRSTTVSTPASSATWPSASRALTEALRAQAGADFKQAAQGRNAALAELQAREKEAYRARVEKSWNREPSSMPRVTAELRRGLPDDVVIVDESITASLDLARAFDYRGFGDYFGGRGGGIGQGLAGAIGVKVAMPDRPVVAVSGDGSAMYSIQALWTAAHHKLAIVFVVLANREYRILKHNVDVWRQNFEAGTQHPYQNMDITGPALDFVHLAAGMGVEAVRVEKAEDIAGTVAKAVAADRPYLVEIAIEGKR